MKPLRPLLAVCVLVGAALGQSACSDDDTGSGGTGGTGGTGTGSPDGGGGQGGGGQGGGGQGGGGLMNTGTDLCPGDAYTLANGDSLLLQGDTAMASDDYNPTCDDGNGPDLVYAITFNEPGTVDVSLFSFDGSIDPVLMVRTGCENEETTLLCRNNSPQSRSYRFAVAADTYYVIVDSASATSGQYNLSITVDTPACGDGAVNPGEECDDGNMEVMDGCDDECHAEAGIDHDCANPITAEVFSGVPQSINGNTFSSMIVNDYNHTTDPNCSDVDGGGPEHVIQLTTQSAGDLHLRLGYNPMYPTDPRSDCDIDELGIRCWVRTMYVRSTCADAGSQVGCFGPGGTSDGPGGDPNDFVEDLVIPDVSPGEVYYVFVDSYWNGVTPPCGDVCVSGPYTLYVSYD
jgi:cysteine-rich repeat protein